MILQKPKFLRSHPSVTIKPTPPVPRFESSGCFLHGSFRRKKCQLLHCVKVANPARLVPLTPIEGVRLTAGGAKRPPQQVQGRSPWRAFGDFPRDGKVTRVPSMALPCSRGAPAYRGPQGPPPLLQLSRGNAVPPSPIPRNEQKVASQRATEQKEK